MPVAEKQKRCGISKKNNNLCYKSWFSLSTSLLHIRQINNVKYIALDVLISYCVFMSSGACETMIPSIGADFRCELRTQ